MQLSVFGLKNCNSAEKRKSRNKFISAFCRYNTIPVIMAMRTHLFPFRTQKLSSSTAKVLDHPRSGRIASCRISKKAQSQPSCGCVLFLQLAIRQGRTRATVNRTADTRCPCSPRWANAKRKAFAVPERCGYKPYAPRESSCRISKKTVAIAKAIAAVFLLI